MNYVPMIEYAGVRYKRVIIYDLPAWPLPRRVKSDVAGRMEVVRSKAYSGEMSLNSQRRFRKAFENLLEIAEWKESTEIRKFQVQPGVYVDRAYKLRFRVNFITLTLPAEQGDSTDRDIYNECFRPFLNALRYRYPGISYIWKAEVQKRGALHYHICTDRYVAKDWLNVQWKRHLQKLGFMSRFRAKFGHSNAPCAQVVAARNDADIGAYLGKYLSKKGDERRKVGCKLWDCSRNLKAPEIRNVPICLQVREWIENLVRSERVQRIQCDQCVVLQSPVEWKPFDLPTPLREVYFEYLHQLKTDNYVSTKTKRVPIHRNATEERIPASSDKPPLAEGGGFGRICRVVQQTELIHRAGRLQAYP